MIAFAVASTHNQCDLKLYNAQNKISDTQTHRSLSLAASLVCSQKTAQSKTKQYTTIHNDRDVKYSFPKICNLLTNRVILWVFRCYSWCARMSVCVFFSLAHYFISLPVTASVSILTVCEKKKIGMKS